MRINLDIDGEIKNELIARKKNKTATEEELKLLNSLRHNEYMRKYMASEKGQNAKRKKKIEYMKSTGRKCNDSTLAKYEITDEEVNECLKYFLDLNNS